MDKCICFILDACSQVWPIRCQRFLRIWVSQLRLDSIAYSLVKNYWMLKTVLTRKTEDPIGQTVIKISKNYATR